MKRLVIGHWSLVIGLALFLSGCVIRTIPYTKERVDQTREGNKGYLTGTPPQEEPREKSPRQMFNIEIELPPHSFYEQQDNELKGNRGYVVGMPETEEKIPATDEKKIEPRIIKPQAYPGSMIRISGAKPLTKKEPAPKKVESKEEIKLIERYIVQKGDTLQRISAKKEVYGDWRKWEVLLEANKEKIKNPDKILPGMELVIPRD